MDPKEVDVGTHEDFYRFVANAYDKPRFTFHFRTDAPMDVRALLYVPDSRPGKEKDLFLMAPFNEIYNFMNE